MALGNMVQKWKKERKPSDDQKDGEWRSWYYNGQRYYKRNYKNGQKDGEWVWWYDNGRKNIMAFIKWGKNGQWFEWSSNGAQIKMAFIKTEKWDGDFKGEIYNWENKINFIYILFKINKTI